MIRESIKEAQYFFYSQAFADGLRASFAIILPSVIAFNLGYFEIGLTISLGAMCVSLTDAPGPIVHKRNGMLAAAGFIALVVLITGFANRYLASMALEIAVVTFFFSMLAVYGNRATAVGNAAVLAMILTMDTPSGTNVWLQALLILIGGLFYFFLSMTLYFIRPYRNAHRVLGECIREVAGYLNARSGFYDLSTDLDAVYKKVIAAQVDVNNKQDAVRELFFKTRQIVEETTEEGRKLVYTFVETVDLFEDITTAYYDYEKLRTQFAHTGAPEIIRQALLQIVRELDNIGIAIQNHSSFTRGFDYDAAIRETKMKIDAAVKGEPNGWVLKRLVVNIRKMLNGLNNINQYFDRRIRRKKSNVDHSHFISHQALDPMVLRDNLSLQSSVFRHAVRVSIACLAGFAIARLFAYGEHSYWILLTIAFILKPAFSLTRQRNIERIIGTVGGGVIGILILVFITDKTILFILLILFMVGTYSFMRINYLVMVIFTTPYVLILFSFFGFVFRDVAQERILDTLIGCAIALTLSYFLFPKWESQQLRSYLKGLLIANAAYLEQITGALAGRRTDVIAYKLTRKDVYLQSANLAAAFQRMLSEPKNKQAAAKQVHQFVVLNHILFSNIATISTSVLSQERSTYPETLLQLARKSHTKLWESIRRFDTGEKSPELHYPPQHELPESTEDQLLKEQLRFIYTISSDIDKTVKAIL